MSYRPSRSGFTLIELLVVISVIAVLAGIALPAMNMVRTNAAKTDARQMVRELTLGMETYRAEDARRRLPPPVDATSADPSVQILRRADHTALGLLLDRQMVQLRQGALRDGVEVGGTPTDQVLCDKWQEPFRYLTKRPTQAVGAATDWNWDGNRGRERAWNDITGTAAPFPYLFSYGPKRTEAPVTEWIYADDHGTR
jgi:prepilin-type N-terminal cleavage/methylation domain-containing protein